MHKPVGQVQFIVFKKKLTSACLFQIAWEKLYNYKLIIYMEKYESACQIEHKQSKQLRTIKAIICNDIFTSLRCKKVENLCVQAFHSHGITLNV